MLVYDYICNKYLDHKKVIKLEKRKSKYPITDLYKKVMGTDIELELWVEVMPSIGHIYRVLFIQ